MGLRGNIAQSLDMRPEDVTRSFMFLIGSMTFYAFVLSVEFIPAPIDTAIILLFVVFWLGYPVALHYDRKYVARNADWIPSRWYYLGFLPSFLGMVFVLYYVHKRGQAFNRGQSPRQDRN